MIGCANSSDRRKAVTDALLFGGSVLAAAMAVAIAGITGMRHLGKVLSTATLNVVQLDHSHYTDHIAAKGQRLHRRSAPGPQRVTPKVR
jgi:hypothetical protein